MTTYAAVELIERNFQKDVVEAFELSRIPAMRADLFRYAILFLYGRIYVDADEACIAPLEDFVDPSKDLVVYRR